MPIKEKCSNPLMALVVFLVVSIVVILTTVIILRFGDSKITPGYQEALVAADNSNSTVAPLKDTTTVTSRPPNPTVPPRNVCESPECITLAQQLHNWADPSVDPCVDFYAVACGKYNEHTVVAGNRMAKKEVIVNALIKDFLIKNKTTSSRSENAMLSLYSKCMQLKNDEDYRDINDELVIKKVLEEIRSIGSWPLLDNKWDESKFDLNEMLQNMAKLGLTQLGLFETTMPDGPDLRVRPSSEEPRNLTMKVAKLILAKANVKVDEKVLYQALLDSHNLYYALTNIYKTGKTAEKTQGLAELRKKLPSVDFEKLIENWVNPKKKHLVKKIFDKILVSSPYFFHDTRNLQNILDNAPKRSLANFLIFQYIELSFQSMSIGQKVIADRNCEQEVKDKLPQATLRVFVQHYFDRENIKLTSDMVDGIKKDFIEMIQDSKWLHEETKKNAILKVQKMKKMIGYPEEFEETGALDKLFETLNILPSDTYYTISTKIRRFETELLMDFIGGEVSINPLNTDIMLANAFYSGEDNSLTVLVPFIDDPLFDSTYPNYVKIASTGFIIAHEMGHGFGEARVLDENGQIGDWWTTEDENEYEKRTQCLVNQYNNYDDPDYGKNLDGETTKEEMLADAVGSESAWRAFKKLDLSKEPRIIGFDNMEKLFFRVFALDFCNQRDESSLDIRIERTHPTDRFRVNGVFSNMKGFAETYNCPAGSPMNPTKKCEIFSSFGK